MDRRTFLATAGAWVALDPVEDEFRVLTLAVRGIGLTSMVTATALRYRTSLFAPVAPFERLEGDLPDGAHAWGAGDGMVAAQGALPPTTDPWRTVVRLFGDDAPPAAVLHVGDRLELRSRYNGVPRTHAATVQAAGVPFGTLADATIDLPWREYLTGAVCLRDGVPIALVTGPTPDGRTAVGMLGRADRSTPPTRPTLGIRIRVAPPDIRVLGTIDGSPAWNRLTTGDLLTDMDPAWLRVALAERDVVALRVLRVGRYRTVRLRPQPRPSRIGVL